MLGGIQYETLCLVTKKYETFHKITNFNDGTKTAQVWKLAVLAAESKSQTANQYEEVNLNTHFKFVGDKKWSALVS
jgi:hypothetical protein